VSVGCLAVQVPLDAEEPRCNLMQGCAAPLFANESISQTICRSPYQHQTPHNAYRSRFLAVGPSRSSYRMTRLSSTAPTSQSSSDEGQHLVQCNLASRSANNANVAWQGDESHKSRTNELSIGVFQRTHNDSAKDTKRLPSAEKTHVALRACT